MRRLRRASFAVPMTAAYGIFIKSVTGSETTSARMPCSRKMAWKASRMLLSCSPSCSRCLITSHGVMMVSCATVATVTAAPELMASEVDPSRVSATRSIRAAVELAFSASRASGLQYSKIEKYAACAGIWPG